MPVDTKQWHAEIENFNGCLDYAVIKLKLNLFNIMVSVSHGLVCLLAILQCIAKYNTASLFLTSLVLIMSPVVSELRVHDVFYVLNSDISLSRILFCLIL